MVALAGVGGAGVSAGDVVYAPAGTLAAGRDGVVLGGRARGGREGWGDDLQARSRLRVFGDGAVSWVERPATERPGYFCRWP